MLVCYLTDEPGKIPAIRAILEPQHEVVSGVLGEDNNAFGSQGVLMVDVDLRQTVRVSQIKQVLGNLQSVSEKLFVVQQHLHHMIAQAYALGATSVVRSTREIAPKLAQIEAASRASSPKLKAVKSVATMTPESVNCGQAFTSIFAAAKRGQLADLSSIEGVTSQVVASIDRNGLSTWIDDVRRYHEGTFQHCLLVTGIAVGFALEVRFADVDVKTLGMAATLHDIGKAHIPLAILNKPGRLAPDEEEIMKRHPVIGYELLKGIPGINLELLDGVRHHHEYLDGSGYPDGLRGGGISDIVRILTIADIFAALIEARPYRSPMSRQDAYKVLCDMDGKLELPLVKAFGRIMAAA